MLSPVICSPITKYKKRCCQTFVLPHSFTTTLMKLLMFLSLWLSKFTSSTLEPTTVGLNSMLALASCLGSTAPILQESCTQYIMSAISQKIRDELSVFCSCIQISVDMVVASIVQLWFRLWWSITLQITEKRWALP